MKTITLDELKKRGLKQGDIVCLKNLNDWNIVTSGTSCEGLNPNMPIGSVWLDPNNMLKAANKVIFKEDWIEQDPIKIIKLFQGNRNYESFPITQIVEKRMAKYIHAVHFGNSKFYTWRVPEKLNKVDFRAGDIVEVDTMCGSKYVQVKETAEYEYDEKTKEVISLIKAYDLPF